MKRFSFQFASNDSKVSVVQYSGSRAQEIVQLGGNVKNLADFKQWVHNQPGSFSDNTLKHWFDFRVTVFWYKIPPRLHFSSVRQYIQLFLSL